MNRSIGKNELFGRSRFCLNFLSNTPSEVQYIQSLCACLQSDWLKMYGTLKKKWTGPASELLLRSNSRLKCILFFYSTVSTILWHFQTIPLMLCSTQLNFPHLLFSKSSFCSFVCKNNVKQTQQNRTTLSNNNKTKQNKKIPHLSKFFLK